MPTTTIELDADLQEKVGALKAPEQSPIAFVRALIEREHSQREQLAAAYQALLVAHPEEQAALAEWASAPLADAPAKSASCNAAPSSGWT